MPTRDLTLDNKVSSADFGRMGCDPPLTLLEAFLGKLKSSEGDLDFILVPGDLVVHGVPLNHDDPKEGNYSLLKQTINTVSQTFTKYFPNTKVLPSMGNNDPKYHYLGISQADRAEYYGFLYNAWFSLISGN